MKLYLIQGTVDFTNMSSSFTQEELKTMKATGMTDEQAKMLADDLGLGIELARAENSEEKGILEADIIQQVKDSSYIGTKEELMEQNFSEKFFD